MQRHTHLQNAINHHLELAGLKQSIELDRGSDVTDLSRNVAVRLRIAESSVYQIFTFVSIQYLAEFFARSDENKYYCSGGPLIVARTFDAQAIVESIQSYLRIK